MAQNPVAIVASVEDVVVMPDASHIVITLDVGGPKVDLALEPELALNLVDACAKGYAESRDIKKVQKGARILFPASGFDIGQNDQRGVIRAAYSFLCAFSATLSAASLMVVFASPTFFCTLPFTC